MMSAGPCSAATLLHAARDLVVLFADDQRVKNREVEASGRPRDRYPTRKSDRQHNRTVLGV